MAIPDLIGVGGAVVRFHVEPEPVTEYAAPAIARIHTAPEPVEDYAGTAWARIHVSPEPVVEYPGSTYPRYHVTNELINTPMLVRFDILAGIPWVWVSDHWERVDAARHFDGADWQPFTVSTHAFNGADWENIS